MPGLTLDSHHFSVHSRQREPRDIQGYTTLFAPKLRMGIDFRLHRLSRTATVTEFV